MWDSFMPLDWENFTCTCMPLELGEFLCLWSMESFMPLELGEFYMYAPSIKDTVSVHKSK